MDELGSVEMTLGRVMEEGSVEVAREFWVVSEGEFACESRRKGERDTRKDEGCGHDEREVGMDTCTLA
ncbi:hypothetical protein PIB30_080405 [Stylosanthes scabra]|uniref:Uncharacterized protein n=1 Tax=Stylosanthes scabra TaxID=79078 RepID=A0ABU6RR89_9FABA|nr:hypothetical protein [Stylosanthes scabra]